MDLKHIVQDVAWHHLALVAAVLIVARVLALAMRWGLGRAAEAAPPHLRLKILRLIPFARVVIGVLALALAIPILIEPTLGNVVALVGSVAFALAFTLKEYASSLAGGLAVIIESTYQVGDWIQIDGSYGEVKVIGGRAVHIMTADETEVIVPHAKLWSASIHNATGGSRSLLCVADFYVHPDHDASDARARLAAVADASTLRKSESKVTVIVEEQPWGTHYRLKAYVAESREQFLFTTDLTVRGKAALRAAGLRFALAPAAVPAVPAH